MPLRERIQKLFRRGARLRRLPALELHVTHACNLTCESCSHYSNHGHSGQLALDEADRWMAAWSGRLAPDVFNLLGGEPTIHPDLPAFVGLARKHWPTSTIRVLTNGFFLHRHPELPRVLAASGRTELSLSIHHDAPEYRERIDPILGLVAAWQREHGIAVEIKRSHNYWTRRYHGFGEAMLPFEDQQPRRSWEICPAQQCKQLFDGKLWKCSPLAYLKLQKAKYDLSDKWDPYLRYRPLEPSCTDKELSRFLAREDESFCSMCSAEQRPFALPIPLPNVRPRRLQAAAPGPAE